MNFNVYIDKKTGERLEVLAKTKRVSRNALIRDAVAGLLARESQPEWPLEVLDFEGIPQPPFEDARHKLRPPPKDPLA